MVNDDIDPIEDIDKKLDRIKKLKDSTEIWCTLAVLYYVIQNIYFFCAEGWHVKPLSETEIIVDGIGSFLFMCCLFMFVRTVWRTIDLVITIVDLD